MNDTIVAISTPFGEGALAVIRMSGARAVEIADRVFRGKKRVADLSPRTQHFGKIVANGEVLDDVLLCVFKAPASYTGEHLVEISGHGGILVSRQILRALLENGARSAEPGEFTQRAFLNGKMDLTQAEAVMDLIKAQTTLALRAATEQLEGRLGARIREIRESLLAILAHVEAFIDFPDEDIDPETGASLLAKLDAVRERVAQLLRTADQGRVLREGVRTVIYGAPNVGKSSLLNLLLGYERAIVSEVPGTTRDTIEEVINLRGIPLRLVDTAGVRESSDAIEKEGIARTLKHIENADLVLHLVDGSRSRSQVLWASEQGTRHREILILNKSDLAEDESWRGVSAVRISCKNGDGSESLAETIFERVMGGGIAVSDSAVAINARHQTCLKTASQFCDDTRKALCDGLSAEFVSIDLRAALDAVGDVVGRADTEELLGKIFSAFCIGK